MSDLSKRIAEGMAALSAAGINLHAFLRTASVVQLLPKLNEAAMPTLMLLGSGGGGLWRALQAAERIGTKDPIDTWCGEAIDAFRADALAGVDSELLWPQQGGAAIPVVRLGEAAGWSHRSRMGIGINERHGLWFAYRGALLIDAEWPEQVEKASANPCDSCESTPCITVCPVGAVGGPRVRFHQRSWPLAGWTLAG